MGRRTILLIAAILVAAAGTTLVFLYARGADARALGEQRLVEVLIAIKPVAAGTTVATAQAAGSFQKREVAANSVVPQALADTSGVADLTFIAAVVPGEQLLRTKVGQPQDRVRLPIPSGKIGISVQLDDPARVADFVAPGSQVAVFTTIASTSNGGSGAAETRLLLQRITVLGRCHDDAVDDGAVDRRPTTDLHRAEDDPDTGPDAAGGAETCLREPEWPDVLRPSDRVVKGRACCRHLRQEPVPMTLIVDLDPVTAQSLAAAIGEESTVLPSLDVLRRTLEAEIADDTIVIGPSIDQLSALQLTEALRVSRPTLGVVLVRRRIDTTVLSEALRSGVREVVEARDLAGVHAAVRRSRALTAVLRSGGNRASDAASAQHRGRVVTVFSAKGGCGKTTLSTNLAAALADGGRREVCLVDLDLAFGDVAIALQLFPTTHHR